MSPESFHQIVVVIGGAVLIGPLAWVATTWMRVRHGYPLDGSWGQALHPASTTEDRERIKLIGSENAQLRAELAGVKDRLAVLERIATDRGSRLTAEIEQLRVAR